MKDTSQNAVSPVIAVILMVAVTVVLSAAVGMFVFDLGNSINSDQPNQNIGVDISETSNGVEVTVVTGTSDELRILSDGITVGSIQNPAAGASTRVLVSKGQTLSIVSVEDGEQRIVSSTSVSSAPVFQKGLVAYYRFETGDGSVAFETARDNEGQLNGSTWSSSSMFGTYSMNFDGDDRVRDTFTPADIRNWSGTTVSFWYRPTSVTASGTGSSWSDVMFSSRYDEYVVAIDNTGTFRWQLYNSTRYYVNSETSPQKNTWYHVTVTGGSSDGMQIFVNGTLENTSSYTGLTRDKNNPRDKLQIGNIDPFWGNQGIHGRIDEFRVYDRVLSQSEVQALYNATK